MCYSNDDQHSLQAYLSFTNIKFLLKILPAPVMRIKQKKLLAIGVIVLAGLVLVSRNFQPSLHASDHIESTVRYVVDGDSLYLEGYQPQIRLWGVDAPEKNELGYDQAKRYLNKIALAQQVHCDIVDIDKYDRSVSRCFLENGDEINRMMIESHTAKEYLRFTQGFYSSPN
ncbi:MAG: thermonuclease family protein [Pseudomonadota bacterium]